MGGRRLLSRIGIFGGAGLFFGGLLSSFYVPEAIALLGPGVAGMVAGFTLGSRRVVCPTCGRQMIQLGGDLPHCPHCGAAFDGPPGSDEERPVGLYGGTRGALVCLVVAALLLGGGCVAVASFGPELSDPSGEGMQFAAKALFPGMVTLILGLMLLLKSRLK